MGQFRQVTKTITVAGGSATGRVWDDPTGMPLKQITIILSSKGQATAAGDLDWNVLYGGVWAGAPFASASTHSGGVSQGSGTIAGGTELLHQIYNTFELIPINNPNITSAYKGFPVVLELTNDKGTPITLDVTFLSETIGTNV